MELTTNTYFDKYYLPIGTTIMHLAILLNDESVYNIVFNLSVNS